MHKAVLHIGSNIGDRKSYLSSCAEQLVLRVGEIVKSSQIYETEAWGLRDQASFLNQAFEIDTLLSVEELLVACQSIEHDLNRDRKVKWGPRTIDIDIIFYNDSIIDDINLKLPHPRMHERNFVLFPLSEIVPNWNHPILNKSVMDLKNESQDASYVSL